MHRARRIVDGVRVTAWRGPTDDVRILLVDDLPEIRRLVELWLEETRARVVGHAGTCELAGPIVERQQPDVVVMDLNMPGADGIECTAELLRRHPSILVVGFTSSEDPSVEARMREAGAVAYFHKARLQDLIAYLTGPELEREVRRRRGAA